VFELAGKAQHKTPGASGGKVGKKNLCVFLPSPFLYRLSSPLGFSTYFRFKLFCPPLPEPRHGPEGSSTFSLEQVDKVLDPCTDPPFFQYACK